MTHKNIWLIRTFYNSAQREMKKYVYEHITGTPNREMVCRLVGDFFEQLPQEDIGMFEIFTCLCLETESKTWGRHRLCFQELKSKIKKMLLSTNISIQKDNALLGRDTENGRVGGFKSRINTVYFCKGESVQRVKRSVKVSKIYKIINTIFLLYKTFKWK